jgi:2-polyprenyl-3-methyl-5-hydroxy-6-metoxy-1,4-benzoquinol methylase
MWTINEGRIRFEKDNQIFFDDGIDHWRKGVCRLLALDEPLIRQWVENVCLSDMTKDPLISLARASKSFFKENFYGIDWEKSIYAKLESAKADQIYYIVKEKNLDHAKLYFADSMELVQPLEYEEEYFEGNVEGLGYGSYANQEDWRLEKAKRYFDINEKIITKIDNSWIESCNKKTVFDIGSGYGFMRVPYKERGYETFGLDISKHAGSVAKDLYGFETYVGEINDLNSYGSFDLVLLYDVIEHILDIENFFQQISRSVVVGGFVVIRTPNLNALEYECFGNRYHSFKIEHLNYFSPESVNYFLSKNGFVVDYLKTDTHMFQGFTKIDSSKIVDSGKGSDIYVLARKK